MLTLIIGLSPILYLIEKNNKLKKNPVPLFPIVSELTLFYITLLFNKFYKKTIGYKINIFTAIISSLLHFFRLLIHRKQYINMPLSYQILGIIANILLYTKFFFIDSFIKLYVIYKMDNRGGVNFVIDPIITCTLIFNYFKYRHVIKHKIIKNYILSDLIYHILEFIFYFFK